MMSALRLSLLSAVFLRGMVICAVAMMVCRASVAQQGPLKTVEVQVDPSVSPGRISPDFVGLGYETSAVAQKGYFSGKNKTLIRLYRNLSPQGLIRIGGNVSDHTRYVAEGVSAAHTERETTIINHTDLTDLADFARATGWKVMWGLNLGTGSKEQAATEAVAVAKALKGHLQSLQIGNEVDLGSHYNRKYGSYQSYYADYLDYKAAVRKMLPAAVFSGPDVAGNLSWLQSFAATEAKDIKLLTCHYYRTGSGKPDATIKTLLGGDGAWVQRLEQLRRISLQAGVPFRINEVNSFYGGGKEGVSDTFGAALWCLDYMFELATYGCNGVNMETDVNQLGWISHYSPIVHDGQGNISVRPEYYGMLAFSLAGKGDLLKITLTKEDINLTAYATRTKGGGDFVWVTIINKDLSRDAKVNINLPENYGEATVLWLKAPSVQSRGQVTLAGSEVAADGSWSPRKPQHLTVKGHPASLVIPHCSAALLRFSH
jgi:hypothetical protein